MTRRAPKVDLGPVPDDPSLIAQMIRGHLRRASREIGGLIAELSVSEPQTVERAPDLFGPTPSPAHQPLTEGSAP